jgi:putative transposase
MEKWRQGNKFQLCLTKKQEKILLQWIGSCRFVYNSGLEHRVANYNAQYPKSVFYSEQQNSLPKIKEDPEFFWLKDPPSQSLQFSLRNLDNAFSRFFQGLGKFPKKKKKGTGGITFPQGNRLVITPKSNKKSMVKIPKLGNIKFIHHRKLFGKIKSANISLCARKFFISILTEEEKILPFRFPNIENAVGIDLGMEKSIAISNGKYFHLDVEKIKNIEKRIEKIQRKMAKQEKFSKRWCYFQKITSRLHSEIADIRRDFLHQKSRELAENQSVVCMEDLRVENMTKSASGTLENPGKNVARKSGLNRGILRQGWGMFRTMLEYKCKKFGATLELVSPKNTSRKCRMCGHTSIENRQTQENFLCVECGHNENADIHAAKNILRIGLDSLGLKQALEAPTIIAQAI